MASRSRSTRPPAPRRRQRRLHNACLFAIAVIVSAAVSCTRCDPDDNPADKCSASKPVIWVGGTWSISGDGKRERCDPADERLEGDFTLDSRLDLLVRAVAAASTTGDSGADAPAADATSDATPPDSTVDSTTDPLPDSGADGAAADGAASDSAPADTSVDSGPPPATRPRSLTLSLRSPPDGFTLSGTINGDCVNFKTVEQFGGRTITYRFVGIAQAGGKIIGKFTGSGPGVCDTSGSFEVNIDLDPDPYPQVTPPPTPDATVDSGPDACVPRTCVRGVSCGQTDDGCGGTLTCGACATGTCGGGGTPGVCGCTPTDDDGPRSPGQAASSPRIGKVPWNDADQVRVSDATGDVDTGAATTNAMTSSRTPSNELVASDFGFKIPSGALITGITVEVRRRSRDGKGDVSDNAVHLISRGTVLPGGKKSTIPWPGSWRYASYGGNDDLWGHPFSAEEINRPDFGVAISAAFIGSGIDYGWIDHVRVTISYAATCPAAPDATPDGADAGSDTAGRDASSADGNAPD